MVVFLHLARFCLSKTRSKQPHVVSHGSEYHSATSTHDRAVEVYLTSLASLPRSITYQIIAC
jgi:hypothetical protein